MNHKAVHGCILGTAVGDALGLPYENLSPRRALKMLGPPTRFRFLMGRGMVSDDLEHTVMVAESLVESGGNPPRFEQAFARRLKGWFLSLPAGIGMATLRACCKLIAGCPPDKSGVFSAGNGPAMRSAILGLFADTPSQLATLVRINTRITHTDPKAESGAFAIAFAAYLAKRGNATAPQEYLAKLKGFLPDHVSPEFVNQIELAVRSVEKGQGTVDFAQDLGLSRGVGGYTYHCIPVVLHCWLTHQNDFRSALESIIACGGDTDTNAAMVGGIVGSAVGVESIPDEWKDGLLLTPMSLASIETLSTQLCQTITTGKAETPKSPRWIAMLARNVFFLTIVLLHGFRRLAPPY